MSITHRISSQNPNHKLKFPETLIHRSHLNLPFNPISGFPVTKHTVTPLTTTTPRWNLMMIVYANVEPTGAPPPPTPGSPFGSWKNWVIGFLMTVIIPFVTTKGNRIKLLMKKVDQIVDTAEHISDVVEAVADKVDKVVEELGDELPEGSELKKTLDFIENVAERLENDAHTAGDFIDKWLKSFRIIIQLDMTAPAPQRSRLTGLSTFDVQKQQHPPLPQQHQLPKQFHRKQPNANSLRLLVQEMEDKMEDIMEPVLEEAKEVAKKAKEKQRQLNNKV